MSTRRRPAPELLAELHQCVQGRKYEPQGRLRKPRRIRPLDKSIGYLWE